jgi:membrane protease subunit HflK
MNFDEGSRIREIRLPRFPARLVGLLLALVFALILLFSSFYTVEPEELGVVLRLGKYVRSSEPGLHIRLPFGFERVTKVPVQRQLKEEFGFRTLSTERRTVYEGGSFAGESEMLTGDLNSAVVEWVVQYRIVDPYRFLFRVRNPSETFRSNSEAVMRKVVGDRTVNEVLTVGRQEVADLVEQELQALCDQYEMGLKVEQVVLQDVNPPDPVKPSFNEVNQAQQEREKLINEAQSEYNKVIPRAQGEALQIVAQAEGYALNRVNRAEGDATRFTAVFAEYQRAPEVTRKRLYLESMEKVLPKVQRKVVIDSSLEGVLPLLNLDRSAGGN